MIAYLAKPEHPLWEILQALTGKPPPDFVKGLYHSRSLGDRVLQLQDWCSLNCRPQWGTGIGLLEAADKMVQEAVDNGNIPPEGTLCPSCKGSGRQPLLHSEARKARCLLCRGTGLKQ